MGGEEALGEALEAREKQRKLTAQQINQARQVGQTVAFRSVEFSSHLYIPGDVRIFFAIIPFGWVLWVALIF